MGKNAPQVNEQVLIPCYEVTVRGQYQVADGKNRILRTFGPVMFVLPEYVQIPNGKKRVNKTIDGRVVQTWEPQFKRSAVTVENVALYVVQRRLLPTWLADKYPDSQGFRTCSIVPGGMKRVMRPEKDSQVLDKPVDQMSIQELLQFCRMKNLNTQVSAFTDVKDAREAVIYELETKGQEVISAAPADEAPEGVKTSSGEVKDADGVPTDEEDPAAGLL